MDSNKIIEIKKPVEEVREIENKEQEQKKDENKGSKVIEKLEEAILPTVHASDGDEEKKKEGARQTIGYTLGAVDAVNPPAGAAASGATIVGGGMEEGIGKFIGNEEVAEGGKVLRQSSTQPLKDAGGVVKEVGKSVKEIFE